MDRRIGLMVVMGVAVVVRLVYVWLYYHLPDWHHLTVDNLFHHHWAEVIALGNVVGDTTYFRAPFYIWCLAVLYAVFGVSLWVGRLFGLAIGLASTFCTYLLGKRMFSYRVGLAAALLQSLVGIIIYFDAELLLDPLFTLLLQIGLLLWWSWHQSGNWRGLAGAGMVLGVATLTRPTALVIVVVLAGVMMLTSRNSLRRRLRSTTIFVTGVLLLVAVTFVRNLAVAEDPVLVASQGGVNFYIGNHEQADGVSAALPEPLGANWRIQQITHAAEQAVGRSLKPGEVSSYWLDRGLEWIGENPLQAVQLYGAKLYRCFSGEEVSNNRDLGRFTDRVWLLRLLPVSFSALFAFSLVAVVGLWRRSLAVRLLGLTSLVYLATVALFFFSSRFRLPVIPLLVVLATVGAAHTLERLLSRPSRGLAWLGLVVGAWAFSALPLVPLPAGTSVTGLLSEGLFRYHSGDYPAAAWYFRKAIDIDPAYPELHLNLGAALLQMDSVDAARNEFADEARLHPKRPHAWTNLASIRLLRDDPDSALVLSRRALEIAPWDLTANRIALRAGFGLDLEADRLTRLVERAAEQTRDNVYLLNEAAALMAEHGMIPQARGVLLRAASSDPPPIETDDAAFEPGFENHPAKWNRQQAQSHYQLGFLSGISQDLSAAITHSRKAIGLDSSLVPAWINLWGGLMSSGQAAAADSIRDEILQRFPDHPLVRRRLGGSSD
jgi:4-amino-4-deoxy-L-arabinose transferase-like glycosyltransferase